MFVDNKDLTREERTEAASDFLTKGRDSDTIRAVVVLTNEVSTLRDFVKELERERNCAKCHVEDSEFCDEVNAALVALEGSCPICRLGEVGKFGDNFECAKCRRRYCGKCGGVKGPAHENVNTCSCEGRTL